MYHRTFRNVETRRFAALLCDYEKVLTNYMGKAGSRYVTFTESCRETQITLIMHITLANGQLRVDHYQRTTNMILQLAKDLWLRADETYKARPNPKVFEEEVKKKHELGGFFLMYTMFEKQPIPGKVRIDLSHKDMKAVNKFCKGLDGQIEEEVSFIMQYLMEKGAFNFCIYSEEFRFEEAYRTDLHVSKREDIRKLLYQSDLRDILISSKHYDDLADGLKEMNLAKKEVVQDMIRTNGNKDPTREIKQQLKTPALKHFISTSFTEGTAVELRRIDALLDIPVMTLEKLIGSTDIDITRRLKMEVQQRMERVRKQKLQKKIVSSGQYKPKRCYVQPGGIFGRKMDRDEGEIRRRRQRGVNTSNLMTYLNGLDFAAPIPERK